MNGNEVAEVINLKCHKLSLRERLAIKAGNFC